MFLVNFFLYIGPVLVLANLFAVYILTRYISKSSKLFQCNLFRKELRTPYNIIFISMALDQSFSILFRNITIWESFSDLGCRFLQPNMTFIFYLIYSFVYTVPWRVFEIVIANACTMLSAHVSWLAGKWKSRKLYSFIREKKLTRQPPHYH